MSAGHEQGRDEPPGRDVHAPGCEGAGRAHEPDEASDDDRLVAVPAEGPVLQALRRGRGAVEP